MKFREFYYLALREEIEFDVIAGDEEMDATVVPTQLTVTGWKKFAPMFEAEIKLIIPPPVAHTITVVEFIDSAVADLVRGFVNAQAGYVSATQYDKWFCDETKSEVRTVAKSNDGELLSLGRYRYAVMHDDKTDYIIYAWNDKEAKDRVKF